MSNVTIKEAEKSVNWTTKEVSYNARLINPTLGEFEVTRSNNSEKIIYNYYTLLSQCCNGNSWDVGQLLMTLR